MITLTYPPKNSDKVVSWQVRLDRQLFKYELKEDASLAIATLQDGDKLVEGVNAIDAYLDELDTLVNGWYEDRCDKYEFDADKATPIFPSKS
ncbi:hypothetical protein D0C36_18815 [Mucilaginibacter conchicola]|uniref:Uncharacterized protein n=1 Tax=Mucilaginibacter conchicola TaxID=2303333 RepID=A0A372NQ60_9SPHI|nr:hypothetical protein [Mucilaginibacter conchicola]RFZ90998.1 hypothetical protein D0C36_18815 [Mucilaginibacter conchicola]